MTAIFILLSKLPASKFSVKISDDEKNYFKNGTDDFSHFLEEINQGIEEEDESFLSEHKLVQQKSNLLYIQDKVFVDIENINFIMILRDPVEQFIAWYNSRIEKEAGTENLSIDECIESDEAYKTCKFPGKHSEYIRYICGYDWFCSNNPKNASCGKW